MKKRLLIITAGWLFLLPFYGNAVEFMYIGNKGFRHFSCGANRRGGIISVKKVSGDKYRIYGKKIRGVFAIPPQSVENGWCSGLYGAARIACGLCPVPDSSQDPLSGQEK